MKAPILHPHFAIALVAAVLCTPILLFLAGCSSGSGSTRYYGSASFIYGNFYYDRWYWGSCCYYPGYPIGPPRPPRPKPEHPIERPPKPKPEHPIAKPPRPKPPSRPGSTTRPLPQPLPAARPARMR